MQVFLGFPQIHYPDLTESQQNIFVSSCVQRLEFFLTVFEDIIILKYFIEARFWCLL